MSTPETTRQEPLSPVREKTSGKGIPKRERMDWLTFIVEMTKALAWPLAVAGVFLWFRGPILQLIPEITKFKVSGLELEFEKQLMAARGQIIEVEGRAEGKTTVKGQAEGLVSRERRLAELSPPAAIIEAWVELEETLKGIASKFDLSPTRRRDPLFVMNKLLELKKIDDQTLNMFLALRALRNNAVHARSSDLTTDQALQYRDLIDRLREKLSSLN